MKYRLKPYIADVSDDLGHNVRLEILSKSVKRAFLAATLRANRIWGYKLGLKIAIFPKESVTAELKKEIIIDRIAKTIKNEV